jgi:hypothetical protein
MTKYIALIKKEQGDTLTLDLTIRNKLGAAVALTGQTTTLVYTIIAAKGGAVQKTKTISDGITLDNDTGRCFIETEIEDLSVGHYYHKVVTTIAGKIETSIYGPIRIK